VNALFIGTILYSTAIGLFGVGGGVGVGLGVGVGDGARAGVGVGVGPGMLPFSHVITNRSPGSNPSGKSIAIV
jgi:hypothetical protein